MGVRTHIEVYVKNVTEHYKKNRAARCNIFKYNTNNAANAVA